MKFFRLLIILLIIILIGLRIALPYCLLKYVENQINKIPEYKVKIADLDVHLYRGAYTLKDIQLWKITKNIPVPFYAAKKMEFSLEWRTLLHGKILAKIFIQQPTINFVTDPSGKNEQITISKQWLDIVKSLYPLNINRLDVEDGDINFRSFKGNPPFKIYLTHTQLTIFNMQEATEKEKILSSSFNFSGDVIGGGKINIYGRFDPFKKQPTFDMTAKLNSLKVANIANFLKHYSAVDVSGGVFSLYGEVAAVNGKIQGYVKPFIKDLKIGKKQGASNPLHAVINGAASLVAKVLENPHQKTIATKIKISGNVNDPDTSILSIIGYLIRHAFIQALLPQIDESVKVQDIYYGKSSSTKNKFPVYRN